MEEVIGQNTKFAAIALSGASSRLQSAVRISDRLVFYPNLPFAIDSHWEHWIGTLRSQEISKANLVLIATLPSSSPGILDAENRQLETTVIKLLYSFTLLGVPRYDDNLNLLTGANVDGKVDIRQLSEIPDFYTGHGNLPYQITDRSAEEAGKIFKALEHVYSVDGEFIQLRRGLKVFLQGLTEEGEYDRLHQFVRSLDALIISERGKGAKQFRSRCCTFAIHNAQTHQIFDEMYELRGRTEHLTDWDELFPKLSKHDRLKIFNQRARQAEALARHTFRILLTTPLLLEHFRTTNPLKTFWGVADDERLKLWPKELKFILDSISLNPPDSGVN